MALALTIIALAAGVYTAIQNAGTWVSYVILGIVGVFIVLAFIDSAMALGFLGISLFLFAMVGFVILFVKFLPHMIGALLFLGFVFALMYAVANFP